MLLIFCRLTLLIMVSFFLGSCSQNNTREIDDSGFFLLKNVENGKFYLVDESFEGTGVGLVDGTILKVAHDDNYIIIETQSIFISNNEREPNEYYQFSMKHRNSKRLTRDEFDLITSDMKMQDVSVLFQSL